MNCVLIASAGGVVPAGVVPVPVTDAVCGLVAALSVTLNCADRVPAAEGENVIESAQFAPGASVTPEH
jgi:hypothetical protein